jgi:hypothetical protein
MPAIEIIKLGYGLDREADGIPCKCGGYAERAACTTGELAEFNCGRSWECCARAFVCKICGARLIGKADAPEME